MVGTSPFNVKMSTCNAKNSTCNVKTSTYRVKSAAKCTGNPRNNEEKQQLSWRLLKFLLKNVPSVLEFAAYPRRSTQHLYSGLSPNSPRT